MCRHRMAQRHISALSKASLITSYVNSIFLTSTDDWPVNISRLKSNLCIWATNLAGDYLYLYSHIKYLLTALHRTAYDSKLGIKHKTIRSSHLMECNSAERIISRNTSRLVQLQGHGLRTYSHHYLPLLAAITITTNTRVTSHSTYLRNLLSNCSGTCK